MLAEGDDARLLWYMNHAHGSGASYNVVTITGVRDGAAWERLARRLQHGDLREWSRRGRHLPPRRDRQGRWCRCTGRRSRRSTSRRSPPTAREHELHLFMEDTGWPTSSLDDYIQAWDDIYRQPMLALRRRHARHPHRHPGVLPERARFVGAARGDAVAVDPRPGDGRCTCSPPSCRSSGAQPGTYMYDALAFRDQWKSRLLRTAAGHRSTDTTCATSADDRPTWSSYVPGSTRHPGRSGIPVRERAVVEARADPGLLPGVERDLGERLQLLGRPAPATSGAAARRSTAPPRRRAGRRCW